MKTLFSSGIAILAGLDIGILPPIYQITFCSYHIPH
jgi:hypothetical protein